MAYSTRFLKQKNLVAQPPQSNDVYIVEYPKSGITWLSTILANLAIISSGREDFEVTFANLRLIIPDIHHGIELSSPIYHSPPLRFIKSHAAFQAGYKFSIYLVRHPKSVASSYYRYMEKRGHIDMPFGQYLRDPKIGVKSWCDHVDSWLKGNPKGGILHLVRYEDLLKDALNEIQDLCRNLGWKVTDAMIVEAIEKASVSHMKASENLFVERDPRYQSGFVKSQELNISEEDKQYIEDTCQEQLRLLGYPEGDR